MKRIHRTLFDVTAENLPFLEKLLLFCYSGMPERGDMVSLALKFGSYTVHRLRYNTIQLYLGKGTVQFTTTRCCGAALFLGRLLPWQLIFHLAPFHVKRKIIFQPINHFFYLVKFSVEISGMVKKNG